jgi:hypothetical protein
MRIDSPSCGIGVDVPEGWWARIWCHTASNPEEGVAPTLHTANFALPVEDGSFGFGVTIPSMGEYHAFLALVEIASPESSLRGSYGSLPTSLPLSDFDGSWLASQYAHLIAKQYFCGIEGRAFCLFAVFGSRATLLETAATVVGMLRGLEVVPAAKFYAA